MDRLDDLGAVQDHVWDRLATAAADPGAAWRTPTFGTAHDGGPDLCTVVLRAAAPEERRLAFHTARRSEKVAAIRAGSRIAWHAWDPDTAEQVRLYGSARVHVDDAVAEAMWEEQSPASLAVHARTRAPGASLDAPDDGLVEAVQAEPIARADVADGWEHFAVVRTVIDAMDWLHLHPEGHYRAQFRYDEAGGGTAQWVAP
jgi:hypothetical protein